MDLSSQQSNGGRGSSDGLTNDLEKMRITAAEQEKRQQQQQQQQQSTTSASSSSSSSSSKKSNINYAAERVIGNGSFGVVYQATVVETGETVAIKKVLQDRRFKNRELQIMGMLNHPNVIGLRHCFYSKGEKVSNEIKQLELTVRSVETSADVCLF